jgi:hypothetical protein
MTVTLHEFGIVAQTGPHTATVFLRQPRTCPHCKREVMLLMLDLHGSRCPTCPDPLQPVVVEVSAVEIASWLP